MKVSTAAFFGSFLGTICAIFILDYITLFGSTKGNYTIAFLIVCLVVLITLIAKEGKIIKGDKIKEISFD